MASNSGWDKTIPSGSSSIAKGDDDIRSFKSFMEAWWEQEHYATDGSATSAGIAKHGAGRAYVGTASQLSNPTADNDGRLFHVRDTGKFYVGDVSTSSWSLVADNIQLSSQNSWTATQEFSDTVVTGSISGVTSHFTLLAAAVEIPSGFTGAAILFENPGGTRFSAGDFMVASVSSFTNANIKVQTPIHSAEVGSAGSIVIRFMHQNIGGGSAGLPSGTTVSVLAFKTPFGAGT